MPLSKNGRSYIDPPLRKQALIKHQFDPGTGERQQLPSAKQLLAFLARDEELHSRTLPDQAPSLRWHFPAVDGLRGAAILSVLFYHAGFTSRGLFGVDVFFVLSGFLITLILLKEIHHAGRISFSRFYARRVKRLVPGLSLTLILALLFTWHLGTLEELLSTARTALFSLLQIANWQQISANESYWNRGDIAGPLAHMWSLSVTEQFYVFWPLLVVALWVAARRRTSVLVGFLVALTGGCALIAPLLWDGTNSDRLYLGTDTRIVCFTAGATAAAAIYWVISSGRAWGSATASTPVRITVTGISALSLTTVVLASITVVSYHEAWLYQGGIAAVAIASATLTGTLALPGNRLRVLFTWVPLIALGRLSYSAFLLHLPIYWLIQHVTDYEISPLVLFGIGLPTTWVLASLLHRGITEPLRSARWKPLASIPSLIFVIGIIAAGSLWLPAQREREIASNARSDGINMPAGALPEPTPLNLPARSDGGRSLVMTVGDSLANDFASMLRDAGSNSFDVIDNAAGGCALFDADEVRAADGWLMSNPEDLCWSWKNKIQWTLAKKTPDIVLVHSAWDAHEQRIGTQWLKPCMTEWQSRYETQLESLMALVGTGPGSPDVVLTTERLSSHGEENAESIGCYNRTLTAFADKYDHVHILALGDALSPQGISVTNDTKGRPLFLSDGVHFTPSGKTALAPWLEKSIATIVTDRSTRK